jgi:hypothetical protein
MKNHTLVVFVSSLLALLGSNAVYAKTNAQKEISTAVTHAGYAEEMTNVQKVHLHLHHVINCLVGPKGVGFDAKAGDPCMGMGNGAIKDDNYKLVDKLRREMLKDALLNANYGLMTNNLQIARNAAQLAAKDLKKSEEDL